MIKVGDLVHRETWSNDKSGFFVIEEEKSTPGRYKARRVMKRDGTIVKKTKLREYFDDSTDPLTVDKLTARFELAVTAAENELTYLKQFIK